MKTKLLLVAIALLLLQSWAMAQNMEPQEMAQYQTETMVTELDLDEIQKEKVAEINLKYAEKQSALMNQKGSMFSKMGDMKKIAQEKNGELQQILSKAQMKKYEDDLMPKMRKQMRKNMKG